MKKFMMFALAAVMMAASATASTAGKKEKKQKKCATTMCCAKPNTALNTKADSLSFAAGMFTTNGLKEYVANQFGVDSTTYNVFVEGLREGIAGRADKQLMARAAGYQIARTLEERIYPNMKNEMEHASVNVDSVLFNAGFFAALAGDTTLMNLDSSKKYYTSTLTAAKRAEEEAYKKQNSDWLATNATAEGVKTLPSGLQYKVLTQGSGEPAKADDNVTVRYEGKMIDGTVFDSSYTRNPDTSTFRPDQVIKGWTEALTMMPAGSTWMLYIPQELGYGSRPAGKIKPYSTLIFKVEVVKIDKKAEAADAKDAKASNAAKSTKAAAKKVQKKAAKK